MKKILLSSLAFFFVSSIAFAKLPGDRDVETMAGDAPPPFNVPFINQQSPFSDEVVVITEIYKESCINGSEVYGDQPQEILDFNIERLVDFFKEKYMAKKSTGTTSVWIPGINLLTFLMLRGFGLRAGR